MPAPLPIDEVLPQLVASLRRSPNLVLIAPPGAGKTTRVPSALLDHGLIGPKERILMLEPRRLAARLSATRIAEERGAKLGGEVGYQIRFEDRTSAATRIAIVTEGILTRRIQTDPMLEGVGAVILDEFHERSVHADLALAFSREVQEVRPELKIVVMSATLDPGPVQAFLGDCPVIESEGRAYPVELFYLERPDDRFPVELLVSGVRRALRESKTGHVLAFLPGAGEIRRAKEQLDPLVEGVDVTMLYGELDSRDQDRALAESSRRKVILSTNIAETSLTIRGVETVVDLGLHKLARHDPARGVDALEMVRISARSAAQRTGRAGRTGPGRAYRLWTEKEQRTLAADDEPEIKRIDLAPLALEIIRWTSKDPRQFRWFEAPTEAAISRALHLLRALGALVPDQFRLTPRGEQLARFPLHPRLASLLVAAHARGIVVDGARLAALASERDILRRSKDAAPDHVGASDLLRRAELMDQGHFNLDAGAVRTVRDVERRLAQTAESVLGKAKAGEAHEDALLQVILAGFPDRIGKRRGQSDEIVMAGGGSLRLAKESCVREGELLVAIEIDGSARAGGSGLIRIASQVERPWLSELGGLQKKAGARWNLGREAAEAVIETRFGELVLDERPDPQGSAEVLAALLAEHAEADLERALPITDELSNLFNRWAFLRRTAPELELPELGPSSRKAHLAELCEGKKSFADLQRLDLVEALLQRVPHEARRVLDKEAPVDLPIPSGRRAKLRYEPDGPPTLSVRLQEIFGLYETPRIAKGRVPVRMELLAPNQRPVQVTQDLKSFWENTYDEVRKELRRRYPKHQWPEDPREGIPTARVRPRR
jgi:ATP-dependent helicase HrpB